MTSHARSAARPGLLTAGRETPSITAHRFAGVALIILAAEFMTAIMLAASMVPGYQLNAGAISDLGVKPESALLFNGSLVLVGVLNILAGAALFRSGGRAWLLGIFGLAGVGAIGAGLFPLDSGDLHSLFALLAFLFFNVEALACAVVFGGPLRLVSALAGTVGLAFVVVMIIGDSGNTAVFGAIGHGGAERMIVYPPMLWMVAFGGSLLAERHN
jgi:hypothetical membrane protein